MYDRHYRVRRPSEKRFAIVLCIALPIAAGIGEAQSASLSSARVHASVEIEPNERFVYRYIVENGAGSKAAHLSSQVAQARTLRWISTDTAARHVTETLQAARASLARKELDAARTP